MVAGWRLLIAFFGGAHDPLNPQPKPTLARATIA